MEMDGEMDKDKEMETEKASISTMVFGSLP